MVSAYVLITYYYTNLRIPDLIVIALPSNDLSNWRANIIIIVTQCSETEANGHWRFRFADHKWQDRPDDVQVIEAQGQGMMSIYINVCDSMSRVGWSESMCES